MNDKFDEFWKVYPKRVNAGRYMAKQVFNKLVTKAMVPADEIINGARRYAEYCRKEKKLGTEFVAMAKTWLNQHRWEDYPAPQPVVASPAPIPPSEPPKPRDPVADAEMAAKLRALANSIRRTA